MIGQEELKQALSQSPKKHISSFSDIFEEEQSANKKADIENENVRSDEKFNAA